MLFCQLGRADSLREICNGLGCCLGRLVHVGIARAPRRSTLSYANDVGGTQRWGHFGSTTRGHNAMDRWQ